MKNNRINENTLLKIFAIILAAVLWIYVHTQYYEDSIKYNPISFSINDSYDNIFSTTQLYYVNSFTQIKLII